MCSHHPSKEKASSRTSKDGKEYVKHHIPGQKNKHLGKRKDKCYRRDCISEKTEVDCVSQPANSTKGKYL